MIWKMKTVSQLLHCQTQLQTTMIVQLVCCPTWWIVCYCWKGTRPKGLRFCYLLMTTRGAFTMNCFSQFMEFVGIGCN